MSERKTPFCHRRIGPDPVVVSMIVPPPQEPGPCRGSRCALWSWYPSSLKGLGCCADNLGADPWLDPAAKEGGK